jgi:hypothetical protein
MVASRSLNRPPAKSSHDARAVAQGELGARPAFDRSREGRPRQQQVVHSPHENIADGRHATPVRAEKKICRKLPKILWGKNSYAATLMTCDRKYALSRGYKRRCVRWRALVRRSGKIGYNLSDLLDAQGRLGSRDRLSAACATGCSGLRRCDVQSCASVTASQSAQGSSGDAHVVT